MTPREAIRAYCRMCVCDQYSEIDSCTAVDGTGPKTCSLWPYRHGSGYDSSKSYTKRTPLKAIKQECLNCQGGSREGVMDCPSIDCPAYKFRLGKNPARKGMGHPNLESLKVARECRKRNLEGTNIPKVESLDYTTQHRSS